MKKKYAVVFLAWGEKFMQEVETCVRSSPAISKYDLVLITDAQTDVGSVNHSFAKIIRGSFETQGLLRKAEFMKFLPDGYDAYLFLDSDTIVIEDIRLGFEKAERFSIAVSPAPHYSLDYFWGFDDIMKQEGMDCRGQLQYNTGVIFFQNSPVVNSVFQRWLDLAMKYQTQFKNDQPFFSLAMEQLDFSPYTLSISYNYRARGDAISGIVRIWHSRGKLPARINQFDVVWPPRRAFPSKMIYPNPLARLKARVRQRVKEMIRHRATAP